MGLLNFHAMSETGSNEAAPAGLFLVFLMTAIVNLQGSILLKSLNRQHVCKVNRSRAKKGRDG